MPNIEERFWTKVRKTDTCWVWTAGKNQDGYGRFQVGRKPTSAHRVAYELSVGPIPDGLQLDHLCRVRDCVNPAHLEPVTQQENIRRGKSLTVAHAAATHCPQGHEYNAQNIKWYQGRRYCRPCNAADSRRRRARHRLLREEGIS
jgi:hypothetical protein